MRAFRRGRFIASAESVMVFRPGGGKTHLSIAPGRAAVETGHSVLCPGATALLAALAKTEPDGQLCSISAVSFSVVRGNFPCRLTPSAASLSASICLHR